MQWHNKINTFTQSHKAQGSIFFVYSLACVLSGLWSFRYLRSQNELQHRKRPVQEDSKQSHSSLHHCLIQHPHHQKLLGPFEESVQIHQRSSSPECESHSELWCCVKCTNNNSFGVFMFFSQQCEPRNLWRAPLHKERGPDQHPGQLLELGGCRSDASSQSTYSLVL